MRGMCVTCSGSPNIVVLNAVLTFYRDVLGLP